MKCSRIFLFTLIFGFLQVFAAERIRIAILPFRAINVSESESSFVSKELEVELIKDPALSVLARAELDKILSEQKFQIQLCDTTECIQKIGDLANAKKLITGTFGRMWSRYFIIVKVIDVQKAKIEASVIVNFPVNKVKDIKRYILETSKELLKKIHKLPVEEEKLTEEKSTEEVLSIEEKKTLMREYFNKATQLYQQGKYKEAIKYWKKVLEIDPDHKLSRQKIKKAKEILKNRREK